MSAAFTPAPWLAQEYEPGGGSGFVRIGDVVIDGIYRGGDSDRLPIEDARLIAAAPDGLDAAQEALIALVAAPDSVAVQIARKKLRAFIAKAEGGAA